MALVVRLLVLDAGPAQGVAVDAEHLGDLRELGVRLGRARELGQHELDHGGRDTARLGIRVETSMPSRTGVVHEAIGPGVPSTPTRQTRHAPNGACRSSKQSVGISAPAMRAASRTVVPSTTSTSVPSTVSVGIRRDRARRGSAR